MARPAKGKSYRYVHPTRKLEVSKAAGSGDSLKMAKEIEKRVAGYERDLGKARKTLEKLTQAVQKSAQPSDTVERGPRRFRTGVVKIRDVQREMTDTTTQMRILAGRRAELLWLKTMLTGQKPSVQLPLGAPPAPAAEAPAPAESGPTPE